MVTRPPSTVGVTDTVDWEILTTEQQQIGKTLDRSLCITAGAGTGKTTTLTARYLRLFERQLSTLQDDTTTPITEPEDLPLQASDIVTTTFTNRAASELEDSIRDEIASRLEDSSTQFVHDYWQTVARDLDDAYIHTLHSFCSRLLREFALESDRVDPGFEVLEGTSEAERVVDAVNQVLADPDTDDLVDRLSELYSRSQLATILRDLLTDRPESRQWADRWRDANPEAYIDAVWEEFFTITPAEARDLLYDDAVYAALEDLYELYSKAPTSIASDGDDAWNRLSAIVSVIESYSILEVDAVDIRGDSSLPSESGVSGREAQLAVNSICDSLTTGSGDRYSQAYRYEGSKGTWGDHPDAQATLAQGMQTLLETLDPSETLLSADIAHDEAAAPYVIALANLTSQALDRYQEIKRENNLVDYTDLVSGALALVDIPEVQATIQDQFGHIMIDEFQDTDPRQWALVRGLTGTYDADFDADHVFVVGDKKQSIYRFRNADVTAFDSTAAAIQDSAPDTMVVPDEDTQPFSPPTELSTNFRSLATTLSFLNDLFEAVFRTGEDAAYEATPQALSAGRVDPDTVAHRPEYVAVPTNDEFRQALCPPDHPLRTEQFADNADLEAYAVAARIATMLDEEMQVYDADIRPDDQTATSRPVTPSDITVLIRSRTDLKAIERALTNADIPYAVASGIGFHETQAVTTLENFLEILADPTDDIHLYGVLRSPMFGLADDDIARAYAGADTESLWEAITTTSVSPVRAVADQLLTFRDRVGMSPGTESVIDSWVSFLTDVIEETGYLAAVAADNGQQAVANVDKFRALIRRFEADGRISLTELLQRLRAHREFGDQEGEATLPEDATGVQIMTIHDAKGEEFPVVVVPGMTRRFYNQGSIGDGALEFETIGETPWAGIKGPDPTDPFDTVDTLVRDRLRSRRQAEERAEEKRVLYVAATRARDKLVLVGRHEGSIEEEGPAFDRPDPEADPRSWSDLILPLLLPDEAGRQLATAPTQQVKVTAADESGDQSGAVITPTFTDDTTARVDRTSPDGPAGDKQSSSTDEAVNEHGHEGANTTTIGSEYLLRLPDSSCPGYETNESATHEYDLSPTRSAITVEDYEYRITASSLPPLLDDEYETTTDLDEAEGILRVNSDAKISPLTTESDPDEIPGRILGDIVHAIAERRPPGEQWPTLARTIARRHELAYDPTPADIEAVIQQATAACEYVDSQTPADPVMTADELSVTVELPHGVVWGDIDHLIVSPEEYVIIDYKTNTVDDEPAAIDELARHYQPQLDAYAVGLADGGDSTRSVRTVLYFTDPQIPREKTYDPDELSRLRQDLDETVRTQLLEEL